MKGMAKLKNKKDIYYPSLCRLWFYIDKLGNGKKIIFIVISEKYNLTKTSPNIENRIS